MSFFDVSPMGGRSLGGVGLGGAGRRKLGMVHKKHHGAHTMHTLGGLFEGGEHSAHGDFMMMPHGGVGLGGRSNKHNPLRGGNAWSAHVAKYRAANPTVSYKDALKEAKKDYTSVAKAKVNKSGKTRQSRGLSRAYSGITIPIGTSYSRARRELTPDELVELAHLVEKLLPKKFKGAGMPVMHHLNHMTGGGLFDMIGSLLGL